MPPSRGWGREDSDIFIRMIRNGVLRKDGRFATAVLHLWHPEADRSRLAENEQQLDRCVAGKRAPCAAGTVSHVIAEIEQGRAEFAGRRGKSS